MNRSIAQAVLNPIIFGLLVLAVSVSAQLDSPCQARASMPQITNFLGMTFIRVTPGSFQMGSPETEEGRDSDETLHTQKISAPFYLQETEVTLGQWWAVMGKRMFMKRKGKKTLPATRISFYDAQRFIQRLNRLDRTGKGIYRLPTEAEWEYACRAGTFTRFSWGDTIDCGKAAFANNSNGPDQCVSFFKTKGILPDGPAPVKSFPPNPWGFYDMHGNVWEWCSDSYQKVIPVNGGENDNSQKSGTRVRRGGSWFKYGRSLRSANRTFAHPGSKYKTTGFRLVLTPY